MRTRGFNKATEEIMKIRKPFVVVDRNANKTKIYAIEE